MNRQQTEAVLLAVAFSTSGSFPIEPGCEGELRRLIRDGVSDMEKTGAFSTEDVELASDSLRAFVLEMKEEARKRNLPELHEFTFGPVMGRLLNRERQGWWPFSLRA